MQTQVCAMQGQSTLHINQAGPARGFLMGRQIVDDGAGIPARYPEIARTRGIVKGELIKIALQDQAGVADLACHQAVLHPVASIRVDAAGQIVLDRRDGQPRSEEHTSELQSLMRISYAVFCLKKKKIKQ